MKTLASYLVAHGPEHLAQRMTEEALTALIPLLAYRVANTSEPELVELLECFLVRWEVLTGCPHEVDGYYQESVIDV